MQHYPPLFDPLLKMMLMAYGRIRVRTKVSATPATADVDLAAHRANLDIKRRRTSPIRTGRPMANRSSRRKAISNKLLQEVLYDVLRLPAERLRKDTGEKSTTADSGVTAV